MNRPSKRFTSTKWYEILVPGLLILLTLSLLSVLVVVGLSMIGFSFL